MIYAHFLIYRLFQNVFRTIKNECFHEKIHLALSKNAGFHHLLKLSKMLKLTHAWYISEGIISHVFIIIVFYSLVLTYQNPAVGNNVSNIQVS